MTLRNSEARDPMMPWSGQFPSGWRVVRLKRAVERLTRKTLGSGGPYIGLENIESWSGRLEVDGNDDAPEITGNGFEGGDVLFGKLRPYLAKVFLANSPGVCSSELLVLRGRELLPRFLRYVLLSEALIRLVDSSTYGAKMPRAEWDFIGNLLVPVPPKPLQMGIADLLDRKTAAIDELVEGRQRALELLRERRAALLTKAATVGLDLSTPTKQSEVPHLGRIAAHWEIQALRHRLHRIEQGWSPECENRQAEENEWGVLKVGCVNGGSFDQRQNKALPSSMTPPGELEVGSGDILVSRANTRELAGSVALVRNTRRRLLLCDKLFRLKYRTGSVDPGYLTLALQSAHARWQIEREATGASDSMQNIGQDTLKRLLIAWPPLEEQKRISAAILRFEQRNVQLKEQIERQVDLLRDYRQSLITAAVTGQLEIATAAEAA